MKRLLVGTAIVLFASGLALAQNVTTPGHPHNLSAALPTSQQVCVFCHTPHQPEGPPQINADPLWNHTQSTNATYNVYDSPTFNAGPSDLNTIVDIGGLSTVSNLCMSCHDGTVGVGSLYNDPNITGGEETPTNAATLVGAISAGADMGTDLSNDHPINFTYNAALVTADQGSAASPGLNDPTVAPISDWLIAGTVQCSSCHSVHDNTNVPLLRVANTNSDLCTTCHAK